MPYSPPSSGFVHDFSTSYTAPSSGFVHDLTDGTSSTQRIFCAGLDASTVSQPYQVSWRKFINPPGVASTIAFGNAHLTSVIYRNHEWTVSYTPPTGNSILHQWGGSAGEVIGIGWEDDAFGTAVVINKNQLVTPSGLLGTAFGTAIVQKPPVIIPVGWNHSAFGTHWISHLRRTLSPGGVAPPSIASTHFVSLFDRTVDLSGQAVAPKGVGTASVQLKLRYILPPYINAPALGNPLVGYHQDVLPSGFDASMYGTAWVHDLTQWLLPSGYIATQWGTQWASHSPRPIAPVGFPSTTEITPSTRWGLATLENRNQYIGQMNAPGDGDGGVFGSYLATFVENRDRPVAPIGHLDSKFSKFTFVENNADPVYPPGLETIGWGTTRVEHSVRYLEPVSWEEFYSHPLLTSIHNAARAIAPSGIQPGPFGLAAHSNIEQNVRFVGRIFEADYGTPFVAFAVRNVAPPSMLQGLIMEPNVELGTRFVRPYSFEMAFTFGSPFLEERFTVFAPSGWNAYRAGNDHEVRNRNRPLNVFPWESLEPGWPTLHLMTRYIPLDGYDQTQWGSNFIDFRTKRINTNGMLGTSVTSPVVTKYPPDPPAQQNIFTSGFQWSVYGTAAVRPNEIEPDGFVATLWGQHEVRLIGAIVSSMLAPSPQFGTAWVKGPQYIEVSSDNVAGMNPIVPPKHVLNPHTIWCTPDVTDQAVANNGGIWKQIDHELDLLDTGERPFFGKDLTVTNQYRAVQVTAGTEFLGIGQPSVANQHRRVYPDGIKAKYGIPRLNYPQILDFRTGINIVGTMGDEHVVELQDRALTVQSLDMPGEGTLEGQYGTATVDFFNRYRYPVGWDSVKWGVPSPQNNRNSQGIRVHYPDPFIPTGTVMTKWGDAMVDFRIRNVYPEGQANTAIGSTPGYFQERMRVTRRSPTGGISPTGLNAGTIGGTTVWHSTRTLFADRIQGNGAIGYPTLKHQRVVALGGYGWDSQEFGDVQRWEEGKIKTQGEVHTAFGNVKTNRVAYPLGLMSELMGSPVVGPGANAVGFVASDYGLATLSYADGTDFVCGQRPRALANHGFDASAFGAATVA